VTRAEKYLTLTYANRRRLHGKEFFPAPSRFIKEIPAEYVDYVRMQGSVAPTMQRAVESAATRINQTGFAIGSNVRHPKFGEGVVLNCEGSGDHARIQVNFADVGSKWLVLAFANLSRA